METTKSKKQLPMVISKPTALRTIKLIIIHCSTTRVDRDFTAKDVDTAHRYLGYSCWGYHYYIRKDGKVENRNHNGIIERFERIKECPCFDVIPEMRTLIPQ